MSKLDKANEVKLSNGRLISDLKNQITTQQRDKTGLDWVFKNTGERCMIFSTDLYHGSYGSSSVCSDNSGKLGTEIAKTLEELKGEIIKRTVKRLSIEIDEAMASAKEEAQSVIDHVNSLGKDDGE